jgi:intracellular septation protein
MSIKVSAKTSQTVRAVVDYGGLVVFLIAYFVTRDMIKATWALMGGSILALAVGLIFERRIAPMPLLTGIAALIFGGLALKFHDPRFVKIKPTAINLVLAAVMLGGAAMRRNPLKALLNGAIHMAAPAWRTLTVRYGLFFAFEAILNEFVWRTQPDTVWVLFRMPGLLILSILFSLTQVPFLMKHAHEAPAEDPPETPAEA